MTTKSDFTEEEWVRVRRAPFVAGMAISMADPGGPIELTKETSASLKSATNPPSREQLLAEIALDIQAMTQERQNPLTGFKPTQESDPRQQMVEELSAVSCHRELQGDRRRVSCLQAVAACHRTGCCGCREGRRLLGLRRRTGQRRRAEHAGPATRSNRRRLVGKFPRESWSKGSVPVSGATFAG